MIFVTTSFLEPMDFHLAEPSKCISGVNNEWFLPNGRLVIETTVVRGNHDAILLTKRRKRFRLNFQPEFRESRNERVGV
jgi:hypothetical protein